MVSATRKRSPGRPRSYGKKMTLAKWIKKCQAEGKVFNKSHKSPACRKRKSLKKKSPKKKSLKKKSLKKKSPKRKSRSKSAVMARRRKKCKSLGKVYSKKSGNCVTRKHLSRKSRKSSSAK